MSSVHRIEQLVYLLLLGRQARRPWWLRLVTWASSIPVVSRLVPRRLLAAGWMSTEQIARALHITGREARTHARKLFFRGLLATSYARKDNGQVVVLWQAK